MPTIELTQGRVDYRVAGPDDSTKPVVVFVHGLLVNGELWTGVADRLAARGIRSIAPTLPLGSHRTAMNESTDLSPRGVGRLILDLLVALDLSDVTLVGNDTGGALCQFALDADSSRVGRLVLTNCDAFEHFPPAPFGILVALLRKQGRIKPLMAPMRRKPMRHSWLGFGGLAHNLDPAVTLGWVEPSLTDAGVRRDLARFAAAIDPADLVEVSGRLADFDKPARLVWGTDDRFFTLTLAHRLADTLPKGVIVEVPRSRTFVALDAPDRLAEEIEALAV